MEKNLQRYVRRCQKKLLVNGFKSGRYDLNRILPIPLLGETSFIKKAHGFISFQFGDPSFFDIWKFLDGESVQVSFLKAYRTSVTNVFLPDEWLDKPDKLDLPEFGPYKTFQ